MRHHDKHRHEPECRRVGMRERTIHANFRQFLVAFAGHDTGRFIIKSCIELR